MTREILLTLLPLGPMLALLLWAAVQDLRTRRIRNWLTLSLAASGLLHSFLGGPVGPGWAMLGLVVGFALPFLPYAFGALGGGDVKLLSGVGAWLGPTGALAVFLGAAVVGLVIVLVQCAWQGRLLALFRNSAVLAVSLAHVGQLGVKHASETGKACRSIDRPLPYAVPVFLATTFLVIFSVVL
jgi:prepilin peptidase CpaA